MYLQQRASSQWSGGHTNSRSTHGTQTIDLGWDELEKDSAGVHQKPSCMVLGVLSLPYFWILFSLTRLWMSGFLGHVPSWRRYPERHRGKAPCPPPVRGERPTRTTSRHSFTSSTRQRHLQHGIYINNDIGNGLEASYLVKRQEPGDRSRQGAVRWTHFGYQPRQYGDSRQAFNARTDGFMPSFD